MTIKRVGIVGSGIMGSGIAEVAAKAGHEVVLRSRKQETADAMVAALEKSLDQAGRAGQARARPTPTPTLGAGHRHRRPRTTCADCDLVIESVVEDLDVKKALFAELDDDRARPSAILATNTSTLPVVEMAMATERPDQVCGVHFFNPAPMMRLVEIVRPLTASDETIAAATAFADGLRQGRRSRSRTGPASSSTPCCSRTSTTRCGCSRTAPPRRDDIDTAMKGGCNFPMGPLALLDLVGLDTSLADPRRALRRVPRPELRRRAAAAPHGRRRPPRPQVRARASTTTRRRA